MIRLKIDELKPGMILAQPVYNQQDLLLLENDSPLTKNRIWMLKTWGIDQVSVKDKSKDDGRTVFETDAETKVDIEKDLKAKFEDVIDDPIMVKIMKAAGRQLQKRISDPEQTNEPA